MKLLKTERAHTKLNSGFTIVELLAVIAVIAVLATIVVISYGAIRQKAADSKRDSDLKSLEDAIETARYNTGKTLNQITSLNGLFSYASCGPWGNSEGVEPKDLDTSSYCWQYYYTAIDDIATAANVNLDDLKKGDARGNPYIIYEREGVNSGNPCQQDWLGYFTGSGYNANYNYLQVPFSLSQCL